jgi:hypothetical protein
MCRLEQIDRIHDMFAERMSTPHSSESNSLVYLADIFRLGCHV